MTIVVRALATVEFTVGTWSSHKTINVAEFNDTVRKEATDHLKHHLKSSNVAVIGHPRICLVTLNEYRELPSPVVESVATDEFAERNVVLGKKVQELEQTIADLRDEKQSLLDAENDMARRMEQLNNRAKSDKLLAREEEIRRLESREIEYAKKSAQQRDRIVALENDIAVQTHENSRLVKDCQTLMATSNALETENKRLQADNDNMQKLLKSENNMAKLAAETERLSARNKEFIAAINAGPEKLNPIQRERMVRLVSDTPSNVMTERYDDVLLADMSNLELACALYQTVQNVERLGARNMELIAAMRDMQEKALKEHAARFGETTLHQLIGDNGEVVHACMTASFPLPKDHWIYQEPSDVAPIGNKLSTEDVTKALAALKYAIQCATRSGKDMDFDPDALCMTFESAVTEGRVRIKLQEPSYLNQQTADEMLSKSFDHASRPNVVAYESNAGAKEPNWQTDGVVQHVGFDASKPFPRFWSAAAYIRQDGPNDVVSVMFDGSEQKWHPRSRLYTLGRVEFTREEAEAIVKPKNVEEPRTNGPESSYPADMPF